MPTYEYLCQDCKDTFAIKASLSEKEKGLKVRCPACGSEKVAQVLSNFFTFSREEDAALGRGDVGGACCPNPNPGCGGYPGCCG